jgi:hypothetical protein
MIASFRHLKGVSRQQRRKVIPDRFGISGLRASGVYGDGGRPVGVQSRKQDA